MRAAKLNPSGSPFPGMNPYLENPELWSEVHSRLIVAIADNLTDQLSEKYRVAIAKRTYFSGEDDSLLVELPDVSVVGKMPKSGQPSATATLTPPAEPIVVTVPIAKEVQERYSEIREVATGSVITAIELLSPKNKGSREGRQTYERKRNQVLASMTHLVEIDLLRGGQPLPILEMVQSDYRVLVSRGNRRPSAQLYAFSIKQEIPQFVVPLAAGDEEPVLDLQGVLQQVYQRGRYHLAVDYTQPPQPPLSEADMTWAEGLLREAGLGIPEA